MKTLYLVILAGTLAWSAAAGAAELRLGTATVRSVDVRLLHLGSLTGREFFDAVVPMEAIEAVIVRTKE